MKRTIKKSTNKQITHNKYCVRFYQLKMLTMDGRQTYSWPITSSNSNHHYRHQPTAETITRTLLLMLLLLLLFCLCCFQKLFSDFLGIVKNNNNDSNNYKICRNVCLLKQNLYYFMHLPVCECNSKVFFYSIAFLANNGFSIWSFFVNKYVTSLNNKI